MDNQELENLKADLQAGIITKKQFDNCMKYGNSEKSNKISINDMVNNADELTKKTLEKIWK